MLTQMLTERPAAQTGGPAVAAGLAGSDSPEPRGSRSSLLTVTADDAAAAGVPSGWMLGVQGDQEPPQATAAAAHAARAVQGR